MDAILSQTADRTAEEDLGIRLGNAMSHAINGPVSKAYVGHTWAEFKAAVDALGVKDSDTLGSIEYGVSKFGVGFITKDVDEIGAIEIRECSRSEVR